MNFFDFHFDKQYYDPYCQGIYSDVLLQTSDISIPMHKCILASRSQYYRNLLTINMSESQIGVLNLYGFERETVIALVYYLYTDILPGENVNIALDLLPLAIQLQITRLIVSGYTSVT
eukprot:TRINITY_DN5787_c0_g2_i2.p1 TRINITY_DN5787_c0_g2~~TRINITY_DN5787_c0_g2_i2.p1  ORF type:complete len:118 (-),score=7.60 TRINITY_DN5787_c0_g2_i2:270-623(-)